MKLCNIQYLSHWFAWGKGTVLIMSVLLGIFIVGMIISKIVRRKEKMKEKEK